MKIKLTESQYNLLIEQGIGKRLAKILVGGSDEIASSLAKALRSVDPTRATKFVNVEIDSFGSLSKHLNDYSDIWKTIIPDQRQFDNVVDTIAAFRNITEDPAKLKKLRDEIAAGNIKKEQFLSTFPSNGGVYEMFDDLWIDVIEQKSITNYSNVSDNIKIVKDPKTNTNVVKTNVGNKEYFLPMDDTQKIPINNEPKIDISLKSPQVVGKKLNISDSDIKKITDNFEKWKRGDGYVSWPFDNQGKKNYVEIILNGEPVKITYGKYGPWKLSQKGAKELPSEIEEKILDDFIKKYPEEGISWENLDPLYTDVNKNYKVQNKYTRFKVDKLQEMGYTKSSGYFDQTILGDNVKGLQTNIDGEQWIIINSDLVKNPDEIKFTLTHELTHVNQESWLHDFRRFTTGRKYTYKNPNVLEVVNKKVKAQTYRYFLLNGPSFDIDKLERLKEMGKITNNEFERYKTIKNKLENLEWTDDEVIKFAENNANLYVESFNNSKFHLNYLSNIVEIEPNFVASIRDIIQKGTTKGRGEGLATFLGESLRKGDFSSPETIRKYTDFGLSIDTARFLSQLEGPIGVVNPKLQKKLKNDLYKQIESLIKDGFPALLPFFLGEIYSDEKNESFKNFNKIIIKESQYNLLLEQGLGKRLAKILAGSSDEIASSLAKALKTIDVARATKFVNVEIDSFSSLLKHLDDYDDVWKTIIPDQRQFDNVVDSVAAMRNITEDPAKLKILRDEIAAGNIKKEQFLSTFPSNGGVYEMFDDLWVNVVEQKPINRYSNVTDNIKIVKDPTTNTNVIRTTDDGIPVEIKDDGTKTDVTDEVLDNLEGEEGINTEYMFFSDDVKSFFDGSDKFLKTEIPKDVEVVVSNLKRKNIDFNTLDKHIEELGIRQWGGNLPENQIWRDFNIDGKPVKFKFGSKGTLDVKPKFWDWSWSKDIKKNWKDSDSDMYFEEYASYWFKKYQKDGFLNTKDYKWDDYFEPYDVPTGVRERKSLPDGSSRSYITVNHNRYNSGNKSKKDFYTELIWTIDHEIGHINQPTILIDRINRAKYSPYIKQGSTDEVINHINKKIDGDQILRYEIDTENVGQKVMNILVNDFNKEFPNLKDVEKFDANSGKIINPDFFEYCANRLTNANMGSNIKEVRNKITVFKNWEKANAYRYFFKNYPWSKEPSIRQTIDQIMSLSDSDLIKYIENNAYTNKDIKKILYDSAYNLSYLSNRVEVEAEFAAIIGNVLRKGTDKNNRGFTTWMVDYLKSPNKKELLKGESGPLRLFKKLKGEYPNPIKQKGFDRFKWFLERLEGQYKAIYPKETKKLYQDLYKQLYELISKGYPALLPFVFADGLDSFEISGEEEKINESIKNFNKIIITESQYKLLKEFKKKAYSFDWDDNILIMPTRIHLDYNVNSNDIADLGSKGNSVWVPVSVSTEQFRSIRHKLGKEFRYPNNDILSAFKDFRDYDAFIEDTKRALSYRSYGPSFNKFKEALISGSDFSIITARSNPPKAIKEGIKEIIRDMSWGEQKEMEKNLNGLSIDEYLNLQDYHPVSSEEFAQRFGLESVGTNPEEGKKIAFKSFVDRIVSQISEIKDDEEFEGISVGFSDDDEGNVEVVEDLIRNELKKLYPEINFIVYDTSDPKDTKKKRIIIKK